MNFCILIELSKKKISFLYNRSDGESKFAPFVGEGSALPLAIYCFGNDIQIGQFAIDEAMHQSPHAYTDVFQTMKTVGMYKYKGNEYHYNTLLKNAIEKYLTHFFDSVLIGQYGRLEQNIASMPLCFVFNSDIDENERLFVKDCFVKGGYSNLATIDYDQIVVEASSFSTNYAVCVTSDGKDLFMSLYETKTHKYLGSSVMPNRGRDPRVETAVNKLWESLGYENYYLNQESEIPILTKIAEDFLSSGELELQQNVLFSDGYARECFLSMRELNDYRYSDDGKIVSDLKNLLQKQNISPLDCTIVLKGKAANNGYFKHIFNGEFNSLLNVNDSFRTKVLTQLLKDIKCADYKFTTGVPQQPIVQPTELHESEITGTQRVPSGLQKREVRSKIAEIKGKVRIKNYSEAKKLANILLDDLHDQGYSMWDVEINSVLKEIPIGGSTTPTAPPMPAPTHVDPPKEDSSKYQREVRTIIAEIKGKIRIKDYSTADSLLSSLESKLHKVGVNDYDGQLEEVKKEIVITAPKPIQTIHVVAKVKPQNDKTNNKSEIKTVVKLSPAEKLLAQGKFADAKRVFASDGDSKMAQICSDFIKSKRVIEQYKMGLEAVKRNKNRTTIANALKDLEKYQKLYKQYNVEYNELEIIINNYKSI